MLTGFNTNIRHRGVLFHVQSEDSGRDHPHIITHLYHGGTIIASEKSSYAAKLDAADLEDLVRQQMESQHKAFLKRLVARLFDEQILERLGSDAFGGAEEPQPTARPGETQPALAAPALADAYADAETRPPIADSAPAATSEEAPDEGPRPFGEGIVTEKPLDEVILSYLVENARRRKRRTS